MRKWVGYALGAAGLAVVAWTVEKRWENGIPVMPKVVADFNNDGKSDVLYQAWWDSDPTGIYQGFALVDGNHAREEENRYRIFQQGSVVFRLPIADKYDFSALDANNDGNLDLMVRNSRLDPHLYRNSRGRTYLGDGKGVFMFSQEHSDAQ